MRNSIIFLVLLLCCLPQLLHSQTFELEKKSLNSLIESGKYSQEELKVIGAAWNNLLEDFGGYPELPYNPVTKNIEYIKVDTFHGIQKKDIYRRVKEWVAINYGSINSVLHYEDYDSGKIIVKGRFSVLVDDRYKNIWGNAKETVISLKCYHTVIFTVKEGRMKTEYRDIEYESESGGYAAGTYYVPVSTIKYDMTMLYPITAKDKSTWVSRLSTLKQTTSSVEASQESIKIYISSVNAEEKF